MYKKSKSKKRMRINVMTIKRVITVFSKKGPLVLFLIDNYILNVIF